MDAKQNKKKTDRFLKYEYALIWNTHMDCSYYQIWHYKMGGGIQGRNYWEQLLCTVIYTRKMTLV